MSEGQLQSSRGCFSSMHVYLLCQNYKKAKQVQSLKIAKIQKQNNDSKQATIKPLQ